MYWLKSVTQSGRQTLFSLCTFIILSACILCWSDKWALESLSGITIAAPGMWTTCKSMSLVACIYHTTLAIAKSTGSLARPHVNVYTVDMLSQQRRITRWLSWFLSKTCDQAIKGLRYCYVVCTGDPDWVHKFVVYTEDSGSAPWKTWVCIDSLCGVTLFYKWSPIVAIEKLGNPFEVL